MNGYYSPYSPQSITEEEQRCFYGNVFSHAEKEFFKHRLQTKFSKISKESIETALVFLEKQKIANYPCLIHTETRGYDWVVLGGNQIELLLYIMMLSKLNLKMEIMNKMMTTSVWNLRTLMKKKKEEEEEEEEE